MEPFSVQTDHDERVCRLTPLGELDIATVRILEQAFETARCTTAEKIVVDLTRLSFIDSSGLNLLLRMAAECQAHDRLRIVNGSPPVVRLFDLARVRDRLPIISGADDPLAPLQPGG